MEQKALKFTSSTNMRTEEIKRLLEYSSIPEEIKDLVCDELCQKRRKIRSCVTCTLGKALILTTLLIEDNHDIDFSIKAIYDLEEQGRLGLERKFIQTIRDRKVHSSSKNYSDYEE